MTMAAHTTTTGLAHDICTVLTLLGQRTHIDTDDSPTVGGVILHEHGDHVVADWDFPRDAHGRTEGHTVQCDALDVVLACLREVLTLHAPAHGWHIDTPADPYSSEPVRIRWR